ncbi:helix-turn-helix transcriptional regulator [Bernardetia sp. ABR2-2B]|uniref:helix-turn-helix domain-containing protein n=1 Tax=Bernardetia sp. ABR2-2B TaxID=3127472 RepID=UPI0030CCC762
MKFTTGIKINEAIKSERILRGLSQSDMSESLGITQNAYSKIERGISSISLERFIEICKILEIPSYGFLEYCKFAINKENYSKFVKRMTITPEEIEEEAIYKKKLEDKVKTLSSTIDEKDRLISILVEKIKGLEQELEK